MQYASHPPSMPTRRLRLPDKGLSLARAAVRGLDALAPLLDLGGRLFVAKVFLKAGLTKIANWDTTFAQFESAYAVPVLSPKWAALLGKRAERVLPVLLVLGLGLRVAALGLFVLNAVAVTSDLGEVGLQDHQTWGLLLLVTLLHGPGSLSLDHLLGRHFGARPQP